MCQYEWQVSGSYRSGVSTGIGELGFEAQRQKGSHLTMRRESDGDARRCRSTRDVTFLTGHSGEFLKMPM